MITLSALLAFAPLVSLAPIQEETNARVAEFPEHKLKIELPELESFESEGAISDELVGVWTGGLGEHSLKIQLFISKLGSRDFVEPEEALLYVEYNAEHEDGSQFRFSETDLIEGEYGYVPYVATGQGVIRSEEGEQIQSFFALTGCLETAVYSIEVTCTPVADKLVSKVMEQFFKKGVSSSGAAWDYEWTDEEAIARWERDAPEGVKAMKKIVRTDHYIFLSNASGGQAYAKAMEKNYKAIRKLYPFPEVKERRLMPVFLFRTPDQYFEYTAKLFGGTIEDAKRTGGHASGDYYATMYAAPGDDVHLHEQVHQIFKNRLYLNGGGSWFQEGVAKYAETGKKEMSGAARSVKKETHKRLIDLVQMESLIFSTSGENVKGGSEAGDLYMQSALVIEFLRTSKFGKKGFAEFLIEVGRTERNDVDEINAALMRVYEVDLVELDKLFVDYCKKR
ncbi:MAG: hypothetical protein ACI8TQ_003233 [Planctomycetota bacterium]|jgi:hypothetical protein